MNIPLKDFLEFATYNSLFDHVALSNYPSIVEAIKNDPSHKDVCYLDDHDVLWTIDGWITECKRVKDLVKLETEARSKISISDRIQQLKNKMVACALKGDMNEAAKIQQQIKQLKTTTQ